MVNFKSSFSFDDSKLRKLQQNIDALSGQHEVRIADLLTDNFIRQHSNFQTLQTLIDASGVENIDDIGNELFSTFISTHTTFTSWEDMVKLATAEYVKRQLGD